VRKGPVMAVAPRLSSWVWVLAQVAASVACCHIVADVRPLVAGALVGVLREDGQVGVVVDGVHPAAARHVALDDAAAPIGVVLEAELVANGLREVPATRTQGLHALGLDDDALLVKVVVDVLGFGPVVGVVGVGTQLHLAADDEALLVRIGADEVVVFVLGFLHPELASSICGGGCGGAGGGTRRVAVQPEADFVCQVGPLGDAQRVAGAGAVAIDIAHNLPGAAYRALLAHAGQGAGLKVGVGIGVGRSGDGGAGRGGVEGGLGGLPAILQEAGIGGRYIGGVFAGLQAACVVLHGLHHIIARRRGLHAHALPGAAQAIEVGDAGSDLCARQGLELRLGEARGQGRARGDHVLVLVVQASGDVHLWGGITAGHGVRYHNAVLAYGAHGKGGRGSDLDAIAVPGVLRVGAAYAECDAGVGGGVQEEWARGSCSRDVPYGSRY